MHSAGDDSDDRDDQEPVRRQVDRVRRTDGEHRPERMDGQLAPIREGRDVSGLDE